MSNPLDTNDFKHYLNFISLGSENLYQIAEPIGFDNAKFVIEQDAKRYGRDLKYGALDKLDFPSDSTNDLADEIQVYNPQGATSNFLDYGYEWLLYIYRKYGFESKVEYILKKEGLTFSFGMLDFTDKKVFDGYQFTCKLIEKNKVQNVKRRFDDKFNAFSDKDVNENTIEPMPTFNYLRRATPLFQESTWNCQEGTIMFTDQNNAGFNLLSQAFFNQIRNVEKSEIQNTLTFLNDVSRSTGGGNYDNPLEDFNIVRALNNLSNLKAIVKFKGRVEVETDNGVTSQAIVRGSLVKGIEVFDNLGTPNQIVIFQSPLVGTQGGSALFWDFDFESEFNLGDLPRDNSIYFLFTQIGNYRNLILKTTFEVGEVTINGTSTSIDQVIKASRYIDLIKQSQRFNQNIPINAPLFQSGGTHYNNAVFTKRMMTQRTDFFYTTTKNVLESVKEVNNDYEFSENELFIGHESNFYENEEIAVFELITDNDEYSEQFNDRAMLNKLQYAYKTYEKDRDTQGTSESIHTESEWRVLNDNVENVLSIKNDFVRDPISIQKSYDLEINQPTSSTTDDDNVYIENFVALPPNTKGGFSANLLMRINDGVLEILNQNSNNTDNDVAFIWSNLGIGTSFTILVGENVGNYTVVEIQNNIIKLTPIGFTPIFNGNAFITFEFTYTNVAFQTRTNEGFSTINGINERFGNLFYSIKRNMRYFFEQFAMALFYSKKDITLGEFKNNGEVETQLTTETELVKENAPILYDSLPNPLITPLTISGTAFAEFSDVLNYLEAYKFNRGFVRIIENNDRVIKGYFTKLEHNWKFNELTFNLEQKFEPEILTITSVGSVINVNDAPYNLSGVSDWWRFENDFLQLFDEKSRPISNKYEFNLVNLNGIVYSSKELLVEALINVVIT